MTGHRQTGCRELAHRQTDLDMDGLGTLSLKSQLSGSEVETSLRILPGSLYKHVKLNRDEAKRNRGWLNFN